MNDLNKEIVSPKPKLLVLQGIPASGKTTYARKLIEEDTSYVRVNRDDLRNMRGIYWLPSQEKLITQWELDNTRTALMLGYNVVSDSTNLNLATIASLTAIAIECGAELEFKLIEADLDECIKRDSNRPNPVGADVIRNFYNKYIVNVSNC